MRCFPKIRLKMRSHTPLGEVAHTLFTTYRQRSMVGLVLMVAQAFFYNAIFFTFALVLTDFFGIPSNHVGWYILPFAPGNFLGPLLLGRLFDTLGRRTMIAITYGVSGVLLALSGYLFSIGASDRADPDHRLDGDLLLCLAGGECGLSHRQRDVSAGSRARWRSRCSMRSAPASAAWRDRRCSAR